MDAITTFVFPVIRHDMLIHALTSLYQHTSYYKFHVIVVDQTIPDPKFEAAIRPFCDLHIKTKRNLGFAQASNLGIRLAPTPFVTVVNDDVVFIPNPYKFGWFEGILESFQIYETAAAVNPYSPKEPGWGYGEEGYREHLTLEESQNVENIQRLIDERKGQMIDGIVCWCTTFRADLLEEIGLFDERWWPGGGEDYDAMGRIYKAGYRALATSLSWCYHHWGKSKDDADGFDVALPPAREYWNKLGEVWPKGFDIWGKDPKTQEWLPRDPEIVRMPL